MWGKKTQEKIGLYFIVFEAILIVVSAAYLYGYAYSLKDSRIYEKLYLSKDIALTISTFSFMPGNLEYDYLKNVELLNDIDLSNYIIGFASNQVEARLVPQEQEAWWESIGDSKAKNAPSLSPFFRNTNYKYDFDDQKATDKMVFSKNGDKISLNSGGSSLTKLRCNTETFSGRVLVVQDTSSDKGDMIKRITEQLSEVTSNSVKYDIIDNGDANIEAKAKDANLILFLETTKNENNIDIIKAYYPFADEKSRNLGCNILNNILESIPYIEGVQLAASREPEKRIKINKQIIILQVGNENYNSVDSILGSRRDMVRVANAIDGGLS